MIPLLKGVPCHQVERDGKLAVSQVDYDDVAGGGEVRFGFYGFPFRVGPERCEQRLQRQEVRQTSFEGQFLRGTRATKAHADVDAPGRAVVQRRMAGQP